ncbi:hypothetical protein ABM310_002296 [Salmonella enterica]
MSQVTLAGKLTRQGVALAFCNITLSLTDDTAVITGVTTGDGDYRLAVSSGTWRVTLQPQNEVPLDVGLIEVNDSTPPQSLDTLLRHLTPETIDAGTLSFFYGLVERAERVSGGMDDLLAKAKASADAAGERAEQAGVALKAAQEIAKTPGPSAYDVWKSQQPEGSDTSMTAYIDFQAGNKTVSTDGTLAGDGNTQPLGLTMDWLVPGSYQLAVVHQYTNVTDGEEVFTQVLGGYWPTGYTVGGKIPGSNLCLASYETVKNTICYLNGSYFIGKTDKDLKGLDIPGTWRVEGLLYKDKTGKVMMVLVKRVK